VPASTGRLPAKPALILALATGLVLTGCGGNGGSSTPSPSTGAASQGTELPANGVGGEPATPPPPTVGEIVWATEIEPGSNRPVAQVEHFTTDATTIFALLPVSGVPVGTIVRAAWSYNETSLDTLTASTTVEVVSEETVWIEFHLSRDGDESWPDGTYTVSMAVGEAVRREASVEVIAAE
jgi:hypothetical protein